MSECQEKPATFEFHAPGGFWGKLTAAKQQIMDMLLSFLALVGVATLVLISYMMYTHSEATAKTVAMNEVLITRQTQALTVAVKQNADIQVAAIAELRDGQRRQAQETRFQTCIYAMRQEEKRNAFMDANSLCNKMAKDL